MRKYLSVFLTIFCSYLCAGSHWNEEQVIDYVHHSEYQRRSSGSLLSQIRFKGNENVLDVGCGDGRNTAWLACLVREGHVIGIDPSEAMLAWAKKQYHPFEFPNLSFMDGDANQLPNAMFDIITSFFSLHIVKDKQSAIQDFFNHLQDQGRVIAVIPPNTNNLEWVESVNETMQSSRWQLYFKDFRSTFQFEDLQAYILYFENAGFTINHAKHIPCMDPFVNRDEAINWFLGTFPQVHYLPKELRKEFGGDIIDLYIQKRPSACSSDGVIYFYWGRYEIIAQKEHP